MFWQNPLRSSGTDFPFYLFFSLAGKEKDDTAILFQKKQTLNK